MSGSDFSYFYNILDSKGINFVSVLYNNFFGEPVFFDGQVLP